VAVLLHSLLNKCLNEHIDAVCEWVVVCISIFHPAVFTQFIPNYSLSFSVRVQEKMQFELN
jgi:hypothetical protein